MSKSDLESLKTLTTPHLADGCLSINVPIRCAPPGIRPMSRGMRCAGRVRPVQHVGSIDVFFECMEAIGEDEVLVIDNAGRLEEACIGDIVVVEAEAAGLGGIIVWGLHRDSEELHDIGFPVFSLGALPTGPQRLATRPRDIFSRAVIGAHTVTDIDFVVADANGVLFLPGDRLSEIIEAATAYRETEASQFKAMADGLSYRAQTRIQEYMKKRTLNPGYNFRQHLKDIAAAGEV